MGYPHPRRRQARAELAGSEIRTATAPEAARGARAALAWSVLVLAGYAACAGAAHGPPTLAVASREGLGLVLVAVPCVHGRLRLYGPTGGAGLRAAACLGAVVLPAWVLGRCALEHAWQLTWPWPWATAAAASARAAWVHVVAVALPEEAFWRGYVQPALQARWPASRRLAGAPMGRAQLAACALFASSHVAGGGSWATLATFFPGLLFAWTMSRHGALCGPWALHAACNLVALAANACLPALSSSQPPVLPL